MSSTGSAALLIVVCLVLIALVNLVPTGAIDDLQPVFWLETVASVSFGLSWLVKGETLLKDATGRPTTVGSL